MAIRKYQHLFFDLDKTLWDFDRNSKIALRIAFFELLPNYTDNQYQNFENIYLDVNEAMWLLYRDQKITKKQLMIDRFNQSLKSNSIKDVDSSLFNERYLQTLALQPHLMDGASEILAYLKKKGYKMSIISNGFKEVQRIKLRNGQIEDYFEGVFVSEDVQKPKPAKEIFEHALKSTNSRKKDSLMIGDDWEADILGANDLGMDTVFYNNKRINFNTSLLKEKSQFTEIEHLNELKVIL